jgi:GH15 family glucan-1,4-alpha-glucosidase
MRHEPSLNLAAIGNCEVAALLDTRGAIVWACWPRLDGDPIFGALLDARGAESPTGICSIEVVELVESRQYYLPNTAIVETVLTDRHGASLRIRDFCPRFRARGRMFRPAAFVRTLEPIEGRPVVRLRCAPHFDYGACPPTVSTGSHHVRYSGDGVSFRITTDASLTALQFGTRFALDRRITLLIGPDETVTDPVDLLARQWEDSTRDYWQDWVRTLAVPFDWQEAVIRAAITLKLCTYEDTGAVLAALTTSIPEAADTERNWDYRYCWLRDAFFVVQALNRLGATRTMEGFLRYIDGILVHGEWGELRPLYRAAGDEPLTERVAAALSGYRGHGPVRVGNQAAEQVQYDVYGSLVLAATQSFFDHRLVSRGDLRLYTRLEGLGHEAVRAYGRPDAGPWEFRGSMRPHTFSAMMCWAACDRLARIATQLGLATRAAHWAEQAARMRSDLLERAWDPARAAFVSTLGGGGELDATALLMPDLGLLPATDTRFVRTLEAIERELVVDGHAMRYRHADDFGVPHNAFNVCTFWYVNALAMVGRTADARAAFERLLACRNHVGLLSEDLDVRTGELWGNFPQTYSMVGIVNSAIRLSRPWEAMI